MEFNGAVVSWLKDIIRVGGEFVTVGWFGAIQTSTNGSAWTIRSNSVVTHLFGVASGNNTVVAVGYDGTILQSDPLGAAATPITISTPAKSGAQCKFNFTGQIGQSYQIQDSSGLLNLNLYSDTIGSLAGAGNVAVVLSTLTTGGNNSDTTFSGTIGGVGTISLIKQGAGRMHLTGTNTYSGKTLVNAGSLFINGQQSGAVAVNSGGSLNGLGIVGAITVTNGLLSPGSDGVFGPGLARLNSGNVTLHESSGFWIDLAGTDAGTNYCQLNVIGTVNLGDAGLSVNLAFASTVSNQFMLRTSRSFARALPSLNRRPRLPRSFFIEIFSRSILRCARSFKPASKFRAAS